jgi:hypothetical protein
MIKGRRAIAGVLRKNIKMIMFLWGMPGGWVIVKLGDWGIEELRGWRGILRRRAGRSGVWVGDFIWRSAERLVVDMNSPVFDAFAYTLTLC